MIHSLEQRHAPGGRLCPAFGGSSSSASSSTTNNTDMRVVGGNDSANISAQNSSVSVVSTDHGAVNAAVGLANKAIDTNATSSAAMFSGALGAVSGANERLALAYQSGQAGDQTSLKYAGFVVVGLAAVMLFKRQ